MSIRTRATAAAIASLLLAAVLTAIAPSRSADLDLDLVKVDQHPSNRDTIVHLFQWPWASIANECTTVLGPKGFGAVQVSPPQEHVVLAGQGYPWWQDYQPVSYQLVSRRGDRAAFASMVSTCRDAGVKIYVDAVINHMTGGGSAGSGPGTAGNTYGQYNYPAVPYGFDDFHHCGRNGNDDIVQWEDRWEAQNCELLNLSDLKTESSYVRGKLVAFMNDLIALGVAGFRVDAAKHMPVGDLQAIYSQLNNVPVIGGAPYIFGEVIESPSFNPNEYAGIGDVTEFRYGQVVGAAFKNGHLSNLNNLAGQMALPSGDAVNFIDNHDTQRGNAQLTYKNGQSHALAQAFSLAWPYGTPQLMSSFAFTDNESSPPTQSNGITQQVTCGSAWVCEHRRTVVANLVGFHNEVYGTDVRHWTAGSSSRIAFGRGTKGFVAFNRDGAAWNSTFTTSLPAGTYCDVASGDFTGGSCTGNTWTVNASSQVTASVPGNGVLALHTGARLTGTASPTASPTVTPTSCTSVAVTFESNATTVTGQNVFIAGSISQLGGWNTANALAMSGATYPIWRATVNLPAGTSLEYKYIKKDGANNVTWESIANRSRTVPSGVCAVTYSETWNVPGGSTPSPTVSPTGCTSVAVTFAVNAPTVWGENVFTAGSISQLGGWNTANALALSSATYPVWRGTVQVPVGTTLEYKYIKKNGAAVSWESGGNRSYTITSSAGCAATLSDTWR